MYVAQVRYKSVRRLTACIDKTLVANELVTVLAVSQRHGSFALVGHAATAPSRGNKGERGSIW